MQVVFILLLLIIAIFILILVRKRRLERTVFEYLSKYTELKDLGTYQEAQPRFYFGASHHRMNHAVLLLHGYSDTPHSFKYLIEELERRHIPYFSPLITGFGLNDFRLLRHVRAEDWLRDAIQAYETVAAIANKVSVLGHSNGGALAAYIAQHRPVEHLILSGPNIIVSPEDKRYKQILHTPIASHVMLSLLPVVKKPHRKNRVTNIDTLDPDSALQVFHYSAIPTRSLKALWDVQDRVDLRNLNMKQLTLVYGKHDVSVDIPRLLEKLARYNIQYDTLCYDNSAHNVLEDYDRKEACEAISRILDSST